MFRKQTHVIDDSFKSGMTLKADDFGVKADIGTLQGVYAVHGLYENDTFAYKLFANIPIKAESNRYLHEARGAKSISYKSIVSDELNPLESPKADSEIKEFYIDGNEINSKTDSMDQEFSEEELSIKSGDAKRPKVEEKQVTPSDKFILNAFDWFLVSSTFETKDDNAVETLDMDTFGKCQRVNVKTGEDDDDLQLHLHIPKSAEMKITSKKSPFILYFADAEKTLFSFEGKKEKDRQDYFCTDGRRFIRDYCYVMSISVSKKTNFAKEINPELMERNSRRNQTLVCSRINHSNGKC